jgi:inositol 1,4,5-triphosphate receptor type 1
VVVGNDILLRVIQAVTKNGISLLNVAMLLCIIIYIYSFISFAFLRKQFDQDDGYWCSTLWQVCSRTKLDLTAH